MHFRPGDRVRYVKWYHGSEGVASGIYRGLCLNDVVTIKNRTKGGNYSFEEFGGIHNRVETCFQLVEELEPEEMNIFTME